MKLLDEFVLHHGEEGVDSSVALTESLLRVTGWGLCKRFPLEQVLFSSVSVCSSQLCMTGIMLPGIATINKRTIVGATGLFFRPFLATLYSTKPLFFEFHSDVVTLWAIAYSFNAMERCFLQQVVFA